MQYTPNYMDIIYRYKYILANPIDVTSHTPGALVITIFGPEMLAICNINKI